MAASARVSTAIEGLDDILGGGLPGDRLYLAVFGVGSAGGMMLMSALFGLPVYLTAARFTRAHLAVRGLAGLFSLGLGLFTVYEIGFAGGLFR